MNAICVDDNPQVLRHIVESCRELRLLDDVVGFTRPEEALEWLRDNDADLVLLDIDMPGMSGLELARRLREFAPRKPVIFVTAYSRFALDAYDVHPSGYLLKPFDQARLAREVEYALADAASRAPKRVAVHTFGHFEILVDGNYMAFRRSKSKELLAYLIDRRGAGISRREAFAVLWGRRDYDPPMQKQLDVVIRSLRDTLQQYGVDAIFELKSRNLRVVPERIDCDLYRVMAGETEALGGYFGEYMTQYAWGEETRRHLAEMKGSRE